MALQQAGITVEDDMVYKKAGQKLLDEKKQMKLLGFIEFIQSSFRKLLLRGMIWVMLMY